MPLFFIPFWLPSYAYRLSLKTTSIVYLPFLFMISSGLKDELSAGELIASREHGAIERLQWWYSLIVIVVTLGCLLAASIPAVSLQPLLSNQRIVFTFLRSHYLPMDGVVVTIKGCHIARMANAAIVIGLFYYANRAEIRLRHRTWSEQAVKRRFEILRNVQIVLSTYTIFCAIVWLLKYAITVEGIPEIPVEFQLIP